MRGMLQRLFRREDGAVAVEYALLLSLIGGAVAAASLALGQAIVMAFTTVGDWIAGG